MQGRLKNRPYFYLRLIYHTQQLNAGRTKAQNFQHAKTQKLPKIP